jgi:hypothetical protein
MADDNQDPVDAAPPGGTADELIYEAEANRRRAAAAMHLVHKEHFAFLFANCFFLAGALAAWTRAPYGAAVDASKLMTGMDTIRGAAIFALAIYGFWTSGIGLYTKKTKVWPFLLNALLGLWVGLGGVIKGFSSPAWDEAYKVLKDPELTPSYTPMDTILAGVGTIAPGFWMLTGASLLVVFIVLKGIMGGAAKSKRGAGGDEGAGS